MAGNLAGVSPCVFAVIATYRRPELLRRALASLASAGPGLAGVVVVNNGGGAETEAVVATAPVPNSRVVTPPENLGTAGGVAAGLRAVFEDTAATHAWILDDDAVATPGALSALPVAAAAADGIRATRWPRRGR